MNTGQNVFDLERFVMMTIEQIKEKAYSTISAGRSEGLTLKEIFAKVFDSKNNGSYMDFRANIVFRVLSQLLEEKLVSYNNEKSLWTLNKKG